MGPTCLRKKTFELVIKLEIFRTCWNPPNPDDEEDKKEEKVKKEDTLNKTVENRSKNKRVFLRNLFLFFWFLMHQKRQLKIRLLRKRDDVPLQVKMYQKFQTYYLKIHFIFLLTLTFFHRRISIKQLTYISNLL